MLAIKPETLSTTHPEIFLAIYPAIQQKALPKKTI
jgi:hypothetical protein